MSCYCLISHSTISIPTKSNPICCIQSQNTLPPGPCHHFNKENVRLFRRCLVSRDDTLAHTSKRKRRAHVQSEKAVRDHLKNKQLLPFDLALQCTVTREICRLRVRALFPANSKFAVNVVLMLKQCRTRLANIKTALVYCLVFTGLCCNFPVCSPAISNHCIPVKYNQL